MCAGWGRKASADGGGSLGKGVASAGDAHVGVEDAWPADVGRGRHLQEVGVGCEREQAEAVRVRQTPERYTGGWRLGLALGVRKEGDSPSDRADTCHGAVGVAVNGLRVKVA